MYNVKAIKSDARRSIYCYSNKSIILNVGKVTPYLFAYSLNFSVLHIQCMVLVPSLVERCVFLL